MTPPKSNGEFAAKMEAVLDTYALPHDPKVPVIVMDEQPVQLLKEVREPIRATVNHPKRVDYEYERAGVASIFVFADPLCCWRRVSVREHRTKIDWAEEVKILLEVDYPEVAKVKLVCDNLNTHTHGAFYEAFPAEVARSLSRRVEFVYTPKHGSWLNVAENELSALTAQCVSGRRFAMIDELREAVTAWTHSCNDNQKGVNWQFTTDNARIKLRSIYPQFSE